MPRITCEHLKYSYYDKKGNNKAQVFLDFNATFEDKKISIILGPSGCGKTTLLNLISGLKGNYEGEILFENVSTSTMTMRDRDLAYITQDTLLYPKMTVFENIAFPLKFTLLKQEEINQRVRDIANKLGIGHCLTRKPKYLSYGQQHRVSIAKALIKEPTLLLCDEPFTGLDPLIRDELTTLLKDYIKEKNITCLFVTHDYYEALRLGDEIFLIEDGVVSLQGDNLRLRSIDNAYLNALKNESTLNERIINGESKESSN